MLLATTNEVTSNKLASYVHFAFKMRNQQTAAAGSWYLKLWLCKLGNIKLLFCAFYIIEYDKTSFVLLK